MRTRLKVRLLYYEMSAFITSFKASDQKHVEWLQHMITIAENMTPESKFDLIAEVNKNPIGIVFDKKEGLEWPHIHLCLCAVYAKNVLKGTAYIPS